MALRYLYLIRHGQYDDSNPDNQKIVDGALSKLGIKQAKKTAQALKTLPISAIHASSMQRTKQTAEPFAAVFPKVKTKFSKRLWEGVPDASGFLEDYFDDMSPKALAEDAARAQKAFEHYFRPTRGKDKHEILISHSNMIRYFVCRVLDVEPNRWVTMDSHNCGITRVSVHKDGYCTLISYNDIGHLTPAMRTDNFHTD